MYICRKSYRRDRARVSGVQSRAPAMHFHSGGGVRTRKREGERKKKEKLFVLYRLRRKALFNYVDEREFAWKIVTFPQSPQCTF